MKRLSAIETLIELASSAPDALSPDALEQLRDFVSLSQLPSGAFADRAGNPDAYYSLFAFLLCRALGLGGESRRLEAYVLSLDGRAIRSYVDWSAWAVVRSLLPMTAFQRHALALTAVLRWLARDGKANRVYGLFTSLIVVNRLWGCGGFFLRAFVRCFPDPLKVARLPATHLASLALIYREAGIDTCAVARALMAYAAPCGGFALFADDRDLNANPAPDMLSTAVSLYALSLVGADLRLVAPSCVAFIAGQFDRGAFLSGDGDETRDLEYTFYGLLGLCSIARGVAV